MVWLPLLLQVIPIQGSTAPVGAPGALTPTVITTATQALVSYNAPSAAACTVLAWRDATTTTQAIAATGSQTFTVATIPTGTFVGQTIQLDSGSASEIVTITAFSLPASTLTATVTKVHVSGAAVDFLVHDIDPILFSGSDLDSRAGNANNGTARLFVLGTRATGLASDNNRYSRALQTNTAHQGSVTCTGAPVAFSFTTQNIPLGETYPEPYPFDATAPGNYGWPSINWNNQGVEYIDPQTGVLIKRVTAPGDTEAGNSGGIRGYISADGTGYFGAAFDLASAWTNPGNVTAGTQSTLATYSGANNTNTLFLAFDSNTFNQGFSGAFPNPIVDNIQLVLYGTGSDASEQFRACLCFYDSGNTCNSPWITLPALPTTAPSSASTASLVFPAGDGTQASYPAPFPDGGYFAGWTPTTGNGLTVPTRGDVVGAWGSFTASGTTITTTSDTFDPRWVAGKARIWLQGSTCPQQYCTIASYINASTLTVTTNPGVTSGNWRSGASGIMIQKAAGSGSASISAMTSYSYDNGFISPNDGNHTLCSWNYNTINYAADGVTPLATPVHGSFCQFSAGPALHLFITETGETRYIDPLYIDNTPSYGGNSLDLLRGYQPAWSDGAFDATNPLKFYEWGAFGNDGSLPTYTGGLHAFFSVSYNSSCNFKAYPHSKFNNTSYYPGQDTTIYWYDSSLGIHNRMWTDSCLSYDATNNKVSAHKAIEQQVIGTGTTSFTDPYWKISLSAPILIKRIAWNNKAMIEAQPGNQDNGVWLGLWDMPSASVVWSSTSYGGVWPMRWVVDHSNTQMFYKPYFVETYNSAIGPPGAQGGIGFGTQNNHMQGPAFLLPTAMYKAGAWSSDTSFTPGPNGTPNLSACPTGLATNLVQQGATGNNCVRIQTQQPCSMTPKWSEPSGNPYVSTTAAITAATTSISVNGVSGISVNTYLVIGGPQDQSSDANYMASIPGIEYMLVTAVGTNTLTVTRGAGGYAFPFPAGTQLYIMTGLSQEAADYPCDHGPTDINGHSMWSMWDTLKPLDKVQDWTDNRAATSPRAHLMVVSSTLLSGSVAARNAVYDVTLSYNPTDDSNDPADCHAASYWNNAWQTGWIGAMIGPCYGAAIDATNPTAGMQYEFYGAGHSAFGYSGTGVGTNIVGASIAGYPYSAIYRMPLMSASNPFVSNLSISADVNEIPSNVGFAGQGTTASYPYQSYPNQSQIGSTDPNQDRWLIDVHSDLPSGGGTQGSPTGNGSNYNTGTLVAGTNHVWAFTPQSGVPDYKFIQPLAYAGMWLFKDVSGPSSAITDTSSYQFCSAYKAGECFSGSAAGTVYMSVPYAGGAVTQGYLGSCYGAGQFVEQAPCVKSPLFHFNGIEQVQIFQNDPAGVGQRLISKMFTGPGLPFFYNNAESDPMGNWAFFNPPWVNWTRNDVFAAKLPPLPSAPASSQTWAAVAVTVPTLSGYDQARIRFGYAENGTATHCTMRTEDCVAVNSTINATTPYYWASETYTWAACASGCTITIPAIPGRVLYYVIDQRNSGTLATQTLNVTAVANP